MTSVVAAPSQSSEVSVDPGVSRRAPAPIAAAGASRASVVLALAVVASGAVGVRDALVAVGWIGGVQWVPRAVDAVDGLTPATWMAATGTALALFGVALMVVAVLPRRRTALPLKADTAVYLSRTDVAKLASAAAHGVPGVLEARTRSSRRKAVVRCCVTGESQELRKIIAEAVSDELGVLHTPPRTVVHLRTESTS